MAGKILFSQTILLLITFALLNNNGVRSNSLHHTIPHMCEAADDSSEECNRSYDKSQIFVSGPLLATKNKNLTVKYTFYGGSKHTQKFTSDNYATEIKKLIVLPFAQWKVLIPGFLNNGFTSFPENVRKAYLRNMENNSSAKYNILIVDWEEGACGSPFYLNASRVEKITLLIGHDYGLLITLF